MANLISLNVLQMPDGTTFSNQANPCPVHALAPVSFQDVAPKTLTATPDFTGAAAVQSQITVAYYVGNNVLTGTYMVSQTVDQIVTAANAALA